MKTILWVDDEIGLLDLLALYLAPGKYSCFKKNYISKPRKSFDHCLGSEIQMGELRARNGIFN
ncbi:hypothetical protein [Mesobacillus foraminis]|uniref:hypothetical protein n=1 Tax=Mesobacillus foraminis TaxID=279826 RepID=UPI0018EEC433|nr:hypothetical protein [Mesobacillus foraminis]